LLSFSPADETDAYAINVEGTRHVIQLASSLDAELHHLSTAYIAGDRLGVVREEEFDCGQRLRNIYERTKFEAEKLVRAWRQQGGRGVIYRPSIIIGDSATGLAFSFSGYYAVVRFFWNLANSLTRRAGRRRRVPLLIPVARDAVLNLVTVDSVVDAIYRLAFQGDHLGRTFHLVHPSPVQITFAFKTSLRLFGFPAVRIWRVSRWTLRALARLGWVVSFLLGRTGYFLRRQVLTYVPYFGQSAVFSIDSVANALGRAYHPPAISEAMLRRIARHATRVRFDDHHQTVAASAYRPTEIDGGRRAAEPVSRGAFAWLEGRATLSPSLVRTGVDRRANRRIDQTQLWPEPEARQYPAWPGADQADKLVRRRGAPLRNHAPASPMVRASCA